jgi:hypothetical protein
MSGWVMMLSAGASSAVKTRAALQLENIALRPAPTAGNDSGDGSVALPAPSAAPESCFFDINMGVLLHEFLPTTCPRNSGPAHIALRYQIGVLHRSANKRPQLHAPDRRL